MILILKVTEYAYYISLREKINSMPVVKCKVEVKFIMPSKKLNFNEDNFLKLSQK